jgi:hypothetical protein
MSIMDKLKKNSKIKETSILSESVLFAEKDITVTEVPMINFRTYSSCWSFKTFQNIICFIDGCSLS